MVLSFILPHRLLPCARIRGFVIALTGTLHTLHFEYSTLRPLSLCSNSSCNNSSISVEPQLLILLFFTVPHPSLPTLSVPSYQLRPHSSSLSLLFCTCPKLSGSFNLPDSNSGYSNSPPSHSLSQLIVTKEKQEHGDWSHSQFKTTNLKCCPAAFP